MTSKPALALALIVLWPASGLAELSNYRVTGIEPTAKGAALTICYANTWPTPQETAANATLRLYVYTAYETQDALNRAAWVRPAPFHKPNAITVGDFECGGTGTKKIPLDYAKLGLAPGQPLLTSVCFLGRNHEWGASQGREAGQVTLPQPLGAAAQKNARLRACRALPFARPRPAWPAFGGRPGFRRSR